ncbi:hypothetical protein KC354_g110 [Hortaea werneckii]|nr:hypothetical protein KC354_g110 [Hortaea werneckii]
MHKESDLEYGAPDSVPRNAAGLPTVNMTYTFFHVWRPDQPHVRDAWNRDTPTYSRVQSIATNVENWLERFMCMFFSSPRLYVLYSPNSARAFLARHLTYPGTEAGQAPLAPVGHLI